MDKQKEKLDQKAIEDKKNKFRQFLSLMGANQSNGQSWNDNF